MAYTTIKNPSLYFNTKLYTGNGGTQSITGVGFQPDFTWIKKRNAVRNHNLFDAVRGVQKAVHSDSTDAEATSANYLTAFGTDGFSVGSSSNVNANSDTYASWNWKANGAGSANTDGSINSTVSVNTTAGFSIVKYTGTSSNATVGHGLGAVPKFIMAKRLTDAESWGTYHVSNGATKYMKLENTEVAQTGSTVWENTPTSSVFSLGTSGLCNGSGKDMVAYCFAEKTGYSKFGKYAGNGNADGTFVYTGFKPAFVIIKGAVSGDGNAAQNWELYDNKRIGHNPNNYTLFPNTTAVDSDNDRIDLLSNGFKIRINSDGVNDNNSTYIYMAFAEEPLVGDNPATAR